MAENQGVKPVEGIPVNPGEVTPPVEDPFVEQGPQEEMNDFNDMIAGEGDLFGIREPAEEPQQTPVPGQPQVQQQPQQVPGEPNKQDSFSYWQSQADKAKYENERIKLELEQLKQQVSQPREPLPGLPKFEIPEQPKEPVRPRDFNYAEAYSDPNSQSAQYLNEHQIWETDIRSYDRQVNKIQADQMNEKFEKMELERKTRIENEEKANLQRQQIVALKNQIQTQFGATPEQSEDFIKAMSDPSSISMENLWKLYALQNSLNIQNSNTQTIPLPTNQVYAPSKDFLKTRQTQQVPTPMGVLPGKSSADLRSPEDIAMDKMLEMEKRDNPFIQ